MKVYIGDNWGKLNQWCRAQSYGNNLRIQRKIKEERKERKGEREDRKGEKEKEREKERERRDWSQKDPNNRSLKKKSKQSRNTDQSYDKRNLSCS